MSALGRWRTSVQGVVEGAPTPRYRAENARLGQPTRKVTPRSGASVRLSVRRALGRANCRGVADQTAVSAPLILKVDEADPLACPKVQGVDAGIALIEDPKITARYQELRCDTAFRGLFQLKRQIGSRDAANANFIKSSVVCAL